MLLEKSFFRLQISFPDFPVHPPHSLVNQVVFVTPELFGQREGILEFAGADERVSCDNRYALPPQTACICQVVENGSITLEQPGPENFVGGTVDQIPIVDVIQIVQIEVDNLLAVGFVTPFELEDENQQAGQATLVIPIPEQAPGLWQRQVPELAIYFSLRWNNNAEELIPFCLLTLPCLEETWIDGRLLGIGRLGIPRGRPCCSTIRPSRAALPYRRTGLVSHRCGETRPFHLSRARPS